MNRSRRVLVDKKKTVYIFVNVLVVSAAGLFIYEYRDISGILLSEKAAQLIMLIMTVVLVHAVKAGRLYLASYNSEMKGMDYVLEYCKVTSVSVIFPFKLGEFFRIYCFGELIGSALKGAVIILLDRFIDTIALVSVVFFAWVWRGGQIDNFVVYILLIFLVFILIICLLYPGIYGFWKKRLLRANASENRLMALKFLESLNGIYSEVENVAKGRGMILYLMSIIAWSIEIGGLYVLNRSAAGDGIYQVILNYLTSAINGRQSMELEKFVAASVVLLTCLYIVVRVGGFFAGKRVKP